ncbi:sugar phosphate isomerase/epimerase [Paenibacillus filicis]|uniref:Sugar phosphate isomerase/epimerase n=1 Tax=Paenibacillus gyeongsangnamensis TaxID=3388067 RepID=A0ABT4QJ55_9BACL|nr:sugar phosphate isomerase/epimerase family protein [Paenibacillus filicis]MCZ8516911.1 sugar phosphate isomerase/epimerase [Paenibacillus filicis]
MNRFRLGILTDEVSQDIREAIRFAGQFGMEALELRSVDDRPLHQLEDEELENIKLLAESSGITICALSAPIFKCELDDPEEVKSHIALAQRYIAIAKLLGAPRIRAFSFWARASFDEALPNIVRELKRIAPYFEEASLTLLLEFDPSVYACNARKTAQLVDAVASPAVKALYDPGNDLWDPDGEIPYPDGYEALKGRIGHIHLKDAVHTDAGVEAVAIGTGRVDYRGLIRRLAEDGYDGYLVLETHYRLGSKLTEEQLKRPMGRSFSDGGREASEEAARSLLDLLGELKLRD